MSTPPLPKRRGMRIVREGGMRALSDLGSAGSPIGLGNTPTRCYVFPSALQPRQRAAAGDASNVRGPKYNDDGADAICNSRRPKSHPDAADERPLLPSVAGADQY